MSVYVDDMMAKYGRMRMCHMIADTEAEIHAMAKRIGVSRKWYQGDHYDVALNKRAWAIKFGAKEISWRDCSLMMIARRRDPNAPLVTPEEGLEIIRARLALLDIKTDPSRLISGPELDKRLAEWTKEQTHAADTAG